MKSGMKRVLLLGSGYVSGPVVEYLTRDERIQVTVGEFPTSKPTNVECFGGLNALLSVLCPASVLLTQAEELAAKYPNIIPVTLDVSSQEGRLDSLVKAHDLVIRCGRQASQLQISFTGLKTQALNRKLPTDELSLFQEEAGPQFSPERIHRVNFQLIEGTFPLVTPKLSVK